MSPPQTMSLNQRVINVRIHPKTDSKHSQMVAVTNEKGSVTVADMDTGTLYF